MATPSGQSASKQAARQQFLCPLTVRQVLESPEDGMKVGSLTVNMVTLAGIVVDVDVTSTNVKFTLSDDTGTIECLEWIESEVNFFFSKYWFYLSLILLHDLFSGRRRNKTVNQFNAECLLSDLWYY